MTQAGVILGTAAYMSPEQAKGRAADRRSDIWAFGCVVYEMLTGARAFEGDGVSDTMAAVLRSEPDWSRLPAGLPPAVRVAPETMPREGSSSAVSGYLDRAVRARRTRAGCKRPQASIGAAGGESVAPDDARRSRGCCRRADEYDLVECDPAGTATGDAPRNHHPTQQGRIDGDLSGWSAHRLRGRDPRAVVIVAALAQWHDGAHASWDGGIGRTAPVLVCRRPIDWVLR
jgi:Protein kinase domain